MRIRIYPYKQGSRSARALADALGGRVLKLEGSRFRQRDGDLIINWGSTGFVGQGVHPRDFLNGGGVVGAASNKLAAFQRLSEMGVHVPRFWTSVEDIPDDYPFDRRPIVCRTVLNGHSGRGIVLASSKAECVPAPLYVEYIPKQDEYRVHVVGDRVVAVQRKARRLDVEEPNWQVRNHANGFNFVREGVECPPDCLQQCLSAVAALGLDFGAVDAVWNEREGRAYVLEVNTAPGLEGTTVDDYANAFRSIIDER